MRTVVLPSERIRGTLIESNDRRESRDAAYWAASEIREAGKAIVISLRNGLESPSVYKCLSSRSSSRSNSGDTSVYFVFQPEGMEGWHRSTGERLGALAIVEILIMKVALAILENSTPPPPVTSLGAKHLYALMRVHSPTMTRVPEAGRQVRGRRNGDRVTIVS